MIANGFFMQPNQGGWDPSESLYTHGKNPLKWERSPHTSRKKAHTSGKGDPQAGRKPT